MKSVTVIIFVALRTVSTCAVDVAPQSFRLRPQGVNEVDHFEAQFRLLLCAAKQFLLIVASEDHDPLVNKLFCPKMVVVTFCNCNY
jgi:hypothetical protein